MKIEWVRARKLTKNSKMLKKIYSVLQIWIQHKISKKMTLLKFFIATFLLRKNAATPSLVPILITPSGRATLCTSHAFDPALIKSIVPGITIIKLTKNKFYRIKFCFFLNKFLYRTTFRLRQLIVWYIKLEWRNWI